jgi:hypothetical protein
MFANIACDVPVTYLALIPGLECVMLKVAPEPLQTSTRSEIERRCGITQTPGKGATGNRPLLMVFPTTVPVRLLGMVFQVEKSCP